MPDIDRAREEAEAAAAEAAQIGGRPSSESSAEGGSDVDEAARPLAEAGQGEAEGFEQSEEQLVERASHGDQHAARQAIEDAPGESDDTRAEAGGEADHEHSSEREEDLP